MVGALAACRRSERHRAHRRPLGRSPRPPPRLLPWRCRRSSATRSGAQRPTWGGSCRRLRGWNASSRRSVGRAVDPAAPSVRPPTAALDTDWTAARPRHCAARLATASRARCRPAHRTGPRRTAAATRIRADLVSWCCAYLPYFSTSATRGVKFEDEVVACTSDSYVPATSRSSSTLHRRRSPNVSFPIKVQPPVTISSNLYGAHDLRRGSLRRCVALARHHEIDSSPRRRGLLPRHCRVHEACRASSNFEATSCDTPWRGRFGICCRNDISGHCSFCFTSVAWAGRSND